VKVFTAGLILLSVALSACTSDSTKVTDVATAQDGTSSQVDGLTEDAETNVLDASDATAPQDTSQADVGPVDTDTAAPPLSDTLEPDGNLDTVSPPVDTFEPELVEDTAPPSSELNVFFTAPSDGSTIEINQPFDVVVLAKDLIHGPEGLEVTISSSLEGELVVLTPDFAGWASWNGVLAQPGWHTLKATVKNPAGEEFIEEIDLGICSYGTAETFDAGTIGADWKIYGDAYFDNGGWLEMTGNAKGKHGAIYNIGGKVNPGDVELSFKIWTGGGINGGADGFAMSVINVPSVFELEEVIGAAAAGGCLGYGVSGNCGPLTVDAFHIEFDTWENDGNPNVDPTSQNHIGITLNGDPSNHLLWTEVPNLEDSQWHEVMIKIVGQNIKVYFDGEEAIQGNLPAFQFHGGFIGFSGTTGWATNFHRFDDLLVKQACEVP
jgi:hypothetical protein